MRFWASGWTFPQIESRHREGGRRRERGNDSVNKDDKVWFIVTVHSMDLTEIKTEQVQIIKYKRKVEKEGKRRPISRSWQCLRQGDKHPVTQPSWIAHRDIICVGSAAPTGAYFSPSAVINTHRLCLHSWDKANAMLSQHHIYITANSRGSFMCTSAVVTVLKR